MPLPKKKVSVKKPVLNLKGEGSPSRPTWQSKYQQIQSSDPVLQNGEPSEVVCSTAKMNPLSKLVGNYNSDSENEETAVQSQNTLDAKVEDFLKEIQSISYMPACATKNGQKMQPQYESFYPQSVTKWQQCYDHNSGYPYYWNIENNEVTWEMPAELKAVIASVAVNQVQHQQIEQYHQQGIQQQIQKNEANQKEKKQIKEKSICRYPWQGNSDSDDEKIEMITSFGPQSGEEEESEEEGITKTKTQKVKKVVKDIIIGPQLPTRTSKPKKSKRNSVSEHKEAESLNDSLYETSSLLTHCVQDTGPPGDDNFNASNVKDASKNQTPSVNCVNNSEVPDSAVNNNSLPGHLFSTDEKLDKEHTNPENCDKVFNTVLSAAETVQEPEAKQIISSNFKEENMSQEVCLEFADDVIAEIEKEMPPDYRNQSEKKTDENCQSDSKKSLSNDSQANVKTNDVLKITGVSGFDLLANYGDDSESEDSFLNEKKKICDANSSKPVFPIVLPEENYIKPLFPCMETETEKLGKEVNSSEKKTSIAEMSNSYEPEANPLDSTTVHKAFKRKKRIEFASTYGPSTSSDIKPSSPDHSTTSTQYNMDPTSNEHRGFGFPSPQIESNKKISKLQSGWIQFIKSETINLNNDQEQNKMPENQNEVKQELAEDNAAESDEVEDATSLLKEKVRFLTEGRDEISPLQQLAIELETLFVAWQQGALSKAYFSRWVKEKCLDLIRHEKSAAPPGWTCLWDRKSRRYFYRNAASKIIQWDYPSLEVPAVTSTIAVSENTKEAEIEGGGEEMELCSTPPPLLSSSNDKISVEHLRTSPVCIMNDAAVVTSPRLTPPPPTQIAVYESDVPTATKSTKKNEEIKSNIEDDEMNNASTNSLPLYADIQNQEKVPPLPPMPPPPPPPPDEPPPPLPNSPPPLPLDPDQPLPPGVDEPEYNMFRRQSPKQSFKKAQADSSAYANDMMMTYGYGMTVQPATSSNTQTVAPISMAPVDYHGYVHDPISTTPYMMSVSSSHVIHCPAKKSKISLSSELDSFYSDIAMLDSSASDLLSKEKQTSETVTSYELPSVPMKEIPSTTQNTTPINNITMTVSTVKQAESCSTNGVTVKKKKKTKLTPGLSWKKKGVSSLVAKWQQVQQEARRDLNSDDDEIDENSSASK